MLYISLNCMLITSKYSRCITNLITYFMTHVYPIQKTFPTELNQISVTKSKPHILYTYQKLNIGSKVKALPEKDSLSRQDIPPAEVDCTARRGRTFSGILDRSGGMLRSVSVGIIRYLGADTLGIKIQNSKQ